MRRSVWIFLASILLPSLGLAWLAVRSARDQQVVLEHQQVIISQNITDAIAQTIQSRMDQVRNDFTGVTEQLLKGSPSPQALADDFNLRARAAWPLAQIGFAVDLNGNLYSPKIDDGPDAKLFRSENSRFLSNRENVAVYSFNSTSGAQASAKSALKNNLQTNDALSLKKASENLLREARQESTAKLVDDLSADSAKDKVASHAQPEGAAQRLDVADASTEVSSAGSALKQNPPITPVSSVSAPAQHETAIPNSSAKKEEQREVPPAAKPEALAASAPTLTDEPNANSIFSKTARQVMPQQAFARDAETLSNTVPEESDFRRVIGAQSSGSLARFLENRLRLMVWSHPADTAIVFGAQLDPARLIEELKSSFDQPALKPDSSSRSGRSDYCVAIIDDTGHPVAVSQPGFQADWKHPFVATEIGEALPHWEAALYLVDPQQIGRAAHTLQATLGLIVLVLVTAIVCGGSLIAEDVRRQTRLAQQKTDFVSNVSHELKTPLTSIRMFADLLAEKRVPDEERQGTYLRIISAEAARLTRLINNVLDFARIERGAPPGEHRDVDLVEAVRDVVETCGPHLEAAGVTFRTEIEAEPLPLRGDRDALAQIILNLISNAEKYGGHDLLVRVRRQVTSDGALGCVDVLDRGPGIPAGRVKTVFELFQRLDDSLSSGIPGSGLGLTLARRLARSHGGDVSYSARAGGGSCFTLVVPLLNHERA